MFLHRLIKLGEAPGFLLPSFVSVAGANEETVQLVDQQDNVLAFEAIYAGDESIQTPAQFQQVQVEIGREAIWAFWDEQRRIYVGNASSIRASGLELLSRNALSRSPLFAAELAGFCDAQAQYPQVLRSAYAALSSYSDAAAATWRDAVVLLPAIKRDVASLAPLAGNRGSHASLDQVQAITTDAKTRIFLPESFAERVESLPTWKSLAVHFDILDFEVVPIRRDAKSPAERPPLWTMIGIGGIANFVIPKSPFNGLTVPPAPANGSFAQGRLNEPTPDQQPVPPLTIGVVGSDLRLLKLLEEGLATLGVHNRIAHLINTRPIGFGSPNPKKASPSSLLRQSKVFDHVWIVAQHRQRSTGSYYNGLTASSMASRHVRAAAGGLIASIHLDEAKVLFESSGTGIGLVGAVKYDSKYSPEELLRRVAYSMICEDAALWSARDILVLWPYPTKGNTSYDIALGEHRYTMRLVSGRFGRGPADVVGFASNVTPTTPGEGFSDFVTSLVSGYGWRLKEERGHGLIFEAEGKIIGLIPVTTDAELARLWPERRAPSDIVITNRTLPKWIREDRSLRFIHYSQFDRFMRDHYNLALFNE